MRVLLVEDEPYMAEAIRDGLRLEAIAADIARDGDAALELLSINVYDIAILDRDIPFENVPEWAGLPQIRRQLLGDTTVDPFYWASGELPLDPRSTGFQEAA